mgnify:CR=1 FL=1
MHGVQVPDDAAWRHAWELKVFAYITLSRAAFVAMRDRGGGVITNVIGSNSGWRASLTSWVDRNLVSSQGALYIVTFALLIIAFAYFYNSIAFDPIRQADQIRRQGGFIPGVRPGPQTERYLAKAVNRITLPGAVFVAFIAILPYLLLAAFGVRNFPFAGTTVLIATHDLKLVQQTGAPVLHLEHGEVKAA